MNQETRYQYQKRIKELEARVRSLEAKLFDFRGACMEIYDGCVEVIGNSNTSVRISWLLKVLKRGMK